MCNPLRKNSGSQDMNYIVPVLATDKESSISLASNDSIPAESNSRSPSVNTPLSEVLNRISSLEISHSHVISALRLQSIDLRIQKFVELKSIRFTVC